MKSTKQQKHNNLPVVIFLGPQGSGKGTQAKLLVEKYGYHLIEMGGLLRAEAKRGTKLGKLIASYIDKGRLVPSWVPVDLVKQEMPKVKGSPVVMDGAPRQIIEARAHHRSIKRVGRDVSVVVYIKLSDKEALKRLIKRGRNDDTPEYIKRRLSWSRAKLGGIMKYFKSQGVSVVEVNGEQPIAKVHKDIVKVLSQHQAL